MTDHNPPKPTLYERPFCDLDKDATVLGSDPFTYDFRAALENAGSSRESTRSTTYGYGRPTNAKTAKAHGLNDGELLELGVAGTTSDRVKALLGQGFVANEIAKRFVKAGELEPTPVSTSTGSGQNGNRTSAAIAAPLRRKHHCRSRAMPRIKRCQTPQGV